MFHQTKGIFLESILRDGVLDTTPRFAVAGKSQEQLEHDLTLVRTSRGLLVYRLLIPIGDGGGLHYLCWEKGERPAGWLTEESRPIGSIACPGSAEVYGGYWRIGVDRTKVTLYHWCDCEKRTHLSREVRRCIGQVAQNCGDDTTQWYFSLNPIPRDAWTVIERWEDSRWLKVT